MWVLGFLFASVVLNGIMAYIIRKSLVIVETFEAHFLSLQGKLKKTISNMQRIDLHGAFQADDEVGIVFSTMKSMVEELDVFIIEEGHGA